MSLRALARQTESTWTGLKLSQIDLAILRRRVYEVPKILPAFAQIGALLLAAEGKKSCCMQVNALAKWILSWIPWGQSVEEKEMKGRLLRAASCRQSSKATIPPDEYPATAREETSR
jgi:hypothetical protein